MIKLVYCIKRRSDISEAEFHRTWREDHGPLVRQFAAVLGARRYIQSHAVAPEHTAAFAESRGLPEPYDGITEVWWDSLTAFEAAMATPEAREAGQALHEDEARFIDFSRSRLFLTEEHEIF